MKGFVNLTHTNNKKIEDLRQELNKKQDLAPKDNIPIVNPQTGKLDNAYLPPIISGTSRKFAGTFGEDGVIVASAYASEVNGQGILGIDLNKCVGFEFAYTGENPFLLGDLEVNKNDLIVCNGEQEPNWTLYDNSDKVVSVNGQTGAVQIDIPQAGIEQLVGTEEKPINFATDMEVGKLYSVIGKITYNQTYKMVTANKYTMFYKYADNRVMALESRVSSSGVFVESLNSCILWILPDTGYVDGREEQGAIGYLNGHVTEFNESIYAPTTSGTAGQILQSNGINKAPTWITPDFATIDDVNNAINGMWEESY